MTDEYAAVTPFQKVPVLDDGGFKLAESIAILRYLCTKYASQIPPHWYPTALQQRAKVDEYLEWQHSNTRMNAGAIFQIIVFQPRITGKPIDTENLKKFKKQLEKTLDHIENYYLKGQDYFAGKDITIADILGICELCQLFAANMDVTVGRPKLAAWMERVKARLEPHFEKAHKFIFMVMNSRSSKM